MPLYIATDNVPREGVPTLADAEKDPGILQAVLAAAIVSKSILKFLHKLSQEGRATWQGARALGTNLVEAKVKRLHLAASEARISFATCSN